MLIILPFLRVRGMALFPFILLQDKKDKNNPVLLNHERIHHRQQVEMLLIFFYVFYLIEYIVYRLQGLRHRQAYLKLSFEKEAYTHEINLNYLKNRPFWAFLAYFK